ncbi:MAG: hypothetical protein AAGD43_19425 [Pseudomonadota bacterium]
MFESLLCPERRHHRLNANNVHHSLQLVGKQVQSQFGGEAIEYTVELQRLLARHGVHRRQSVTKAHLAQRQFEVDAKLRDFAVDTGAQLDA